MKVTCARMSSVANRARAAVRICLFACLRLPACLHACASLQAGLPVIYSCGHGVAGITVILYVRCMRPIASRVIYAATGWHPMSSAGCGPCEQDKCDASLNSRSSAVGRRTGCGHAQKITGRRRGGVHSPLPAATDRCPPIRRLLCAVHESGSGSSDHGSSPTE